MVESVPSEESHRLWLHNCILRYFRALGFQVWSDAPTTRQEKKAPWDLTFDVQKGNVVKRFCLQVKRPYRTRSGALYWELDKPQYERIQRFPWVYYAFPLFTDRRLEPVACHHVYLTNTLSFQPRVRKSDLGWVYKWGAFAEGVRDCRIGHPLTGTSVNVPLEQEALDLPRKGMLAAEIDLTRHRIRLHVPDPGEEFFLRKPSWPPAPPPVSQDEADLWNQHIDWLGATQGHEPRWD